MYCMYLLEQVDIKPGTLTTFASCYFENKPKIILCLPENPSALLVSAYIFLLPLVNWIHGVPKEDTTINAKVKFFILKFKNSKYICIL